MTTVEQAAYIIQNQIRDYGTETVPFDRSAGRVLAEDIYADRDMPPFNRVTMDGIAISYSAFADGLRSFHVSGIQAAGDKPLHITDTSHCIEIMTGAVLPDTLDTVIRYEDVLITGSDAEIIIDTVKQGQNIHAKGRDKRYGDVVVTSGQLITPAIISVIASVGKTQVLVKKQPRVVIIPSGDELVDVHETPAPYQIRKSNNHTINAVLQQHGCAADMVHIADDEAVTRTEITRCLKSYDVILLSGGVSMGKFDYIPQALQQVGVAKLFYKVQQRPGKPFWFGVNDQGVLVFAFPGNPVATFMCLHRYFLPWLNATVGLDKKNEMYAALSEDFYFEPDLQYFLQVKTTLTADARLIASPLMGNGSGDFANLADTDAFLELPADRSEFEAGEVFRLWPFK
ncbi:molybdopterin molybdotransferase MoeA [Mucilaginibacter boryungensis]|uniref:Molybdopterin molybdenumtransferase n=1 Tax=Mucilaginibacter boryungensis TaxID=768480 RepID=A0ABR9XCW2_9SPHI|nr:molybdopterin molybdotransferase MoeA [Mucilaginibacter boryungensis]MBE9664819.1 molybdopterin molybdotransferase MoeA [Mucilaginibacter boryungensis]